MLLNNHTYYSLRYGTFSEKELLRLAQEGGYTAIALTDINNTSACLNFIRLAAECNIKPLVGIDFRNGAQQLYVGIAQSNTGFMELNTFLSYHTQRKQKLPESAPLLQDVLFIYPFEQLLLTEKMVLNDQEYVGVSTRDFKKIRFSKLYAQQDKLVLLQTVTFRHKRDFNVHRLLRAIDNNTLLSKLDVEEQGNPEQVLLPKHVLEAKLQDFPFLISNTQKLIDRCTIQFGFGAQRISQNKISYTGNDEADIALLKKLCTDGLSYRYDAVNQTITDRIAKELTLIQQQNYVPFFLINWDIVSYAQRKGYYHVGRGSGANSIVAYLLGITDVDPIELDLYFERFMNLYRANPPDFDIDFSWRDRADVTRYIFERFGKEGQVALLATYNTFQHKGAVRELGKVFGLPKHEIDLLSMGKYNPDALDQYAKLVHQYAQHLTGMPNHLSIHAGGILIAEKPMHYYCATDLPPKGFQTTQFDMHIAEDIGLFKYDILGQRGLGKIKDTIAIVSKNRPQAQLLDIHNIKPLIKDPNINKMVSMAQCVGCFYVESPAMRMLLKKLAVNTYLGLVAASSIIRPGVAQSGMMREYILRHKNPERRKNAHPVMWELMPETYGVMVYQEDVIKVAHHFAGLSLGEADVLRRGMSGKYRSRAEFLQVKEKFIANCKAKGYTETLIIEVWNQVESFAGYAFAKGHSASYAVESYQSLYLKCYYPLEYMVAVLNNGGGFYSPETYIHEARVLGATIHAPCINQSFAHTTIIGTTIYLGFNFLEGIASKAIQNIVEERQQNGLYLSLADFIARVKVSAEALDLFIRIKAFQFTGINKRELLWDGYYQLNRQPETTSQTLLFKTAAPVFELPKLPTTTLEEAFDQIEILGFPLISPFALLKDAPNMALLAKDMPQHIGKTVLLYGYLVTRKRTTTNDKKQMFFGTFLDAAGHWIDTVHFPPVAAKYPFRGKGIYALKGVVVDEFDFLSLEIIGMQRLAYVEDVRFAV